MGRVAAVEPARGDDANLSLRGRRSDASSERGDGRAKHSFHLVRSLVDARRANEGMGDRRTFVARPSFDGAPVSIVSMVTSSDIIPPSLIARRVLGVAPGE